MKTMIFIFLVLFALTSGAQKSDFSTINFQKADSIALVYSEESLNNLPELSHKLTVNLPTDVERFRAIYKWVCNNIANDYRLYLKNAKKRQRYKDDSLKLDAWNQEFKRVSFEKLLKRKRTICTGYAYLVKELACLSNLNCEIVQGYGKTSTVNTEELTLPNHTWNAVKLNGKWYLCDATWASGIPNPETNKFEFRYNDGFFFPDPRLFAINHFPVDKKWMLLEDQPSFDMFLEAPILYNDAYTHLISHSAPKKLENTVRKGQKITLELQLTDLSDSQKIRLLIDSGTSSVKVKPLSAKIKNKELFVEYLFKRKGLYDVHLYIGPNLISTYVFDVKN